MLSKLIDWLLRRNPRTPESRSGPQSAPSRDKGDSVHHSLEPSDMHPPNISHLGKPGESCRWNSEWFLPKFTYSPKSHRWFGPVDLNNVRLKDVQHTWPKDGANAWTLLTFLGHPEKIPDQWKGKNVAFLGTSYYEFFPHKVTYYGKDWRDVRAVRKEDVWSGTVVPVLYWRDHSEHLEKEVVQRFRIEDDDYPYTIHHTAIGHDTLPPNWDVKFVRVGEIRSLDNVFYLAVPDSMEPKGEESFPEPRKSTTTQSSLVNPIMQTNEIDGYYTARPVTDDRFSS